MRTKISILHATVVLGIVTLALMFSCESHTPDQELEEEVDSRGTATNDSTSGLTIMAADTAWQEIVKPFQ